MSEVKRFTEGPIGKGIYANPEGELCGFHHLERVTAERDAALGREAVLRGDLEKQISRTNDFASKLSGAQGVSGELQQRLTAADERADVLEGLLRTSLVAMKRIYQAGYDRIIDAGGTCDTPDYMMESDPTVREIRAALKQAEENLNQCDGCQAGIPVVNGAHRMGKPGGYPDTMSCTAKLYKP